MWTLMAVFGYRWQCSFTMIVSACSAPCVDRWSGEFCRGDLSPTFPSGARLRCFPGASPFRSTHILQPEFVDECVEMEVRSWDAVIIDGGCEVACRPEIGRAHV